ncbi:MAG: homoserine dehydrogenase [Deltaproteobacteria bacterium]|nr:homoserine dehydrogenase [Deltaproteobacteria bacterium]
MKTIHLGLYGLGVVGGGVAHILHRNQELIQARLGAALKISRAVVRDPKKTRGLPLDGVKVTTDPNDILNDPEIDIVVELMGGTDLAAQVVLGALNAGKPVVTANKALLAVRAAEIFPKAYETGLPLGIEASVAGGVPVLRALREGLAADHIEEVCGIVNGTCNYILTKMTQEGAAFGPVLAEAQKLGYAEADPTFDVDGHDTAQKLAVLVNLAYGAMVHYPDIYKEGIRGITPLDIEYAKQLGYTIKLLAIGKRVGDKVEARVHPTLVAHNHLLSQVNGVFNAVYLTGDNVGASLSYGRGAGAEPTGSAVVSDIMDIARDLLAGVKSKVPPLGVKKDQLIRPAILPIEDISSEYYLRFQVLDRPGTLAKITSVLGSRGISIQSMFQPSQAEHPEDPVQVILITHQAKERDVAGSLKEIEPLDFVLGKTQLIRIERLGG